jgi:glycosyltransferase involved in cell wall biosynthesis
MHVSVCICTYKRPVLLKQTLTEVSKQNSHGLFTFSAVVVDNDGARTGRPVVEKLSSGNSIEIKYCEEPRRSIAHARNTALSRAKGDAIAFIDDDEFPAADWLFNLYKALVEHNVAGVLGPVRPHFAEGAPAWVRNGGFYDRPEHQTGFVMPWTETRTGNVLFHRCILKGVDPVFSPEFGTGGSDVDFFRRMMALGHKFIWCNEAVVYEVVPPKRWSRQVILKRALLRGSNSFRHQKGRGLNLAKAVVALPLYSCALPFLQLCGHHLFMKYLVKSCDHAGRLLAALGVHPVKQREMG